MVNNNKYPKSTSQSGSQPGSQSGSQSAQPGPHTGSCDLSTTEYSYYSAPFPQTSSAGSAYVQPGGYGASCPPGCTCGNSLPVSNPSTQQTTSFPGYQYFDYYTSAVPVSSPASYSSFEQQYERGYSAVDVQQESTVVDHHEHEESGKYPFSMIAHAIARGLVGEGYGSHIRPDDFRTKLNNCDSQRLSGLQFFSSFTQRDLNLQCTLILQVLHYWSLPETIPDCARPGSSSSSECRSSHGKRRDSGVSSKRRRPPPAPRFWTRMENAAVVGLMLGLHFDLLKLALEGKVSVDLREVDAILDTNSAEALELCRTGQIPSGARYQRDSPPARRQPFELPSSMPMGENIWIA